MALPDRREGPSSLRSGRVAAGLVVLAVAFLTAFAAATGGSRSWGGAT